MQFKSTAKVLTETKIVQANKGKMDFHFSRGTHKEWKAFPLRKRRHRICKRKALQIQRSVGRLCIQFQFQRVFLARYFAS